MPEFNNEYLTDILEAIEQLEKTLLDYDEVLSNNENDPAQIHIIFRNAHNLKGILGLAQLENSQSLIHAIEDNFDRIRNGKLNVSPNLIDNSLKALDLISTSLTQDKEDTDAFNNIKEALKASDKSDNSGQILPFELSPKEKDTALNGCSKKSAYFVIEKLIKSNIDKESYSNLPIFQDVEEAGTLIGFRPEWENINTKSEDELLRIFFITEKKEKDLFFIIFDPLKPLSKDEICAFLSADVDKKVQDESIEKTEKSISKKLNILLVEDDFITRTLESKILSMFGNCDVTVNGKEAITTFRNSLRGKNYYDLIVLDIMLPEVDGEGVLNSSG
ncbi:MAG: Hpt domain-containing protein [Spirochaetota bacterium]|nr:Hpt domain-containing protein [Spirochaetota bacterium]